MIFANKLIIFIYIYIVHQLRNLYTIKLFFLIKELAQISIEIIFEGGLVSHENLDRCENLTEYVKTLQTCRRRTCSHIFCQRKGGRMIIGMFYSCPYIFSQILYFKVVWMYVESCNHCRIITVHTYYLKPNDISLFWGY